MIKVSSVFKITTENNTYSRKSNGKLLHWCVWPLHNVQNVQLNKFGRFRTFSGLLRGQVCSVLLPSKFPANIHGLELTSTPKDHRTVESKKLWSTMLLLYLYVTANESTITYPPLKILVSRLATHLTISVCFLLTNAINKNLVG